ncbi:hypothetical protein CSC3H3_23045 (plasmid) [Thalassospira marina]|uniref:Uncharacterized protein n=2 Tax=Thalassospira marina TaxID=2048283 RepID=A0A2N3KTI9_9PROT|nr:hypothetical protein CSC3H3_23045 [Thalassospira marina]PKR53878.1 hypothetical protein COO20_12795 [Thalassospira marina]
MFGGGVGGGSGGSFIDTTSHATAGSTSESGHIYSYNNAPFSVGGAAQTPVNMIASIVPWVVMGGVAWLLLKK